MPAELISINNEVISGGIARFIVVLIISFVQGALIGFEREKAKVDAAQEEHYKGDFPGLRTFSLIAITGGLSGVLLKGDILVPAQVASLFFLFSAIFIIILALFFALYRFFKVGFVGMTTYIVMPLTFMIGLLTGLGYVLESLSLTFIASLILSMKRISLKLTEKLSYEEYAAGLELGLVVFVIGPIIYALNPSVAGVSLWSAYLFFIIVLVVSYTSYLSYKVLGKKSLKVISILGGLVNSEATFTAVSKFVSSTREAATYLLYVLYGLSIRGLVVIGLGSLTFLGATGATEFIKIFIPGYLLLMLTITSLQRIYKVEEKESGGEMIIKSPLEFKSALRAAVIYVAIFVSTKLTMLINMPVLLNVVSFIGGLASAIATAFSLLSNYPAVTSHQIAIGSLVATLGALINKIFYAKISYCPESVKEIAKISLVLSAVLAVYIALVLLLSF
ncbi:MAG: DUF4010 domain-containing protein [Desulfurococcales archaeon]|jgi:uncharacterized membrane protein (DUF4010 family)|nr:DUF4010 domain-containing protein [Desulfurococcales archaeon]